MSEQLWDYTDYTARELQTELDQTEAQLIIARDEIIRLNNLCDRLVRTRYILRNRLGEHGADL